MASGNEGIYEDDVLAQNTSDNRRSYVAKQSSTYPPLYYWVGSLFHQLVSDHSFFTRLYTVRFTSLLSTFFIPLVVYYFGTLIWGRSLYSATLAFMVFFFPMTTYLGVGINSDDLHFLLFGLALTLYAAYIKNGLSTKLSLAIGVTIGLDLLTKPQGYILFPLSILAFLLRYKFSEWRTILRQLPFLALPIIAIAGWQEIPKFIYGNDALGTTSYVAREFNFTGITHFRTYLSYYLRTHTSEIIVWYWGVFKWSGIILPRIWWQIANRLVILAAIGIILRWFKDFRARQFSFLSRLQLFAIGGNAIYILAIAAFDWQFYQEFGHSLGLQARYYLPMLLTQMFLLLSGILELGWSSQLKGLISRSFIIFFLGLHLVSVYIQLSSYYDFNSISTLFAQLSQYKPILAKGNWWYLWFSLYFLGIITSLVFVLRANHENINHSSRLQRSSRNR